MWSGAGWIRHWGGVAVWKKIDLSHAGEQMLTPALTGKEPTAKPHWSVANTPRVITDAKQVLVAKDKEVRRFHVAVRMGGQGLSLKVTDGGTRRIRAAVAKAGEGAYYTFDYDTQEAVIWVCEQTVSLPKWERAEIFRRAKELAEETT
jgi:ribosomal protein S6